MIKITKILKLLKQIFLKNIFSYLLVITKYISNNKIIFIYRINWFKEIILVK